MNLRLVVPSLAEFSTRYPLPAGLRRLRRATRHSAPGAALETWLCQLYGLDNSPVAALTATIDVPAHAASGWLRADPVHLALGQNSVSVLCGDVLDLRAEEAEALGAAVAPLLDSVEARLLHEHAQRWYLQLPQPPRCRFLALHDAVGRPLPPVQVEGPDAALWKRLGAEIQMVLHQHPVNEAREQRGLPPINHLWLWGEGAAGPVSAPSATVRGDHIVLRGLAQLAQAVLQPAPATFDQWRSQAEGNDHIVVLDSLLDCARCGDGAGWHAALESLVEDWLQPALHARLHSVEIIVPASSATTVWQLGRWDPLFFWKNTHVGA